MEASRLPRGSVAAAPAARLAALIGVVVAVLLGVRGIRIVHAERAYVAGLGGFVDNPSSDEPGRLEQFEIAASRAPGEFLYRLRSGQIRLSRAAENRSRDDLERARVHLEAAVRIRPLDARGRLSRARVLGAGSSAHAVEDSIAEAKTAIQIGQRHAAVHEAAVLLGLEIWLRDGDIAPFRFALETERARRQWTVAPALRPATRVLVRRIGGEFGVAALEASGSDEKLLATAATMAGEAGSVDAEWLADMLALRRAQKRSPGEAE